MTRMSRTKAESETSVRREAWGWLEWLANKEISGSELTLGRVVIKKGMSNTRHIHANAAEVLYLLSGKLDHSVGDANVVLEAGDTVYIPQGVPHHADSIGDVDADMIVAYDTGSREFKPVK